ncbi:MAG: type III pantothenate kinase [Candidatus Omnitrophica bacterium]|nr:type III pantothenate kinase [Candidatus Omnitrophota bacterium]MDE2008983.1 type III pantothenate kinase [Candidatus Omnitrophota bacterium]MDE2214507.1 type III pantothenate kinase [Candidatus Omnitrophota bacterium]MDE2230825.1 type III pantothenate kinase [Candidatus Omnitrophota bacterium]
MLLAVDIGNTTIGFAVLNNSGRIKSSVVIDTDSKTGRIKAVVAKILKAGGLKRAIICSVVPRVSKVLENILKKSMPVDIIGRDIFVPVRNRYKNPKQVGQDRLVGAFGAMKIYGRPLIVVDLGTAVTFDVISPKGEYLGGAIVPGLRLSAESLFLKTALLPHIEIAAPRRIIGRTTRESILSGLFYGYGSLCRGFIDLISRQINPKPKVVMTGGHTRLMKKFVSPKIRIIDEDLVFKGIYFLSRS